MTVPRPLDVVREQLARTTSDLAASRAEVERLREALGSSAAYIASQRAWRHGKPLGDDCRECARDQRELDRIGAVLAAVWDSPSTASIHPRHHCMSCGTLDAPGPGCVNCRQTGYDQTPCKACAQDPPVGGGEG